MNQDLLNIKKYYGENMMHLCRSLFPTLLETEGFLFNLIEENFAYSKLLYDDIIESNSIEDFKNYIYGLVDVENENNKSTKTPAELLDEAGYILYECKNEKDIQKFKKYYAKREELCTFDGNRLDKCYVFFAVKKNVDEIKREDFKNPMRQDEYGTSVISIQFTRGTNNTLSIKNRYNHMVNNPDATFSNNLENIIAGLTESFEEHYHLNIVQNNAFTFSLPNYVKASDGKFYKYNYEIHNVYYCPNNIIIDNFEVISNYQDKEKYLIVDYFIIDLENKRIELYDKAIDDTFTNRFRDIKLIEIIKDKKTKNKKIGIVLENNGRVFIEIDRNNRMIYYSDAILEIDDNYLTYNEYLECIDLPNVKKIGFDFLTFNKDLLDINLPCVQTIGGDFLYDNKCLRSIYMPNVEEIEYGFLENNLCLKEINLPKVKKIGATFLLCNKHVNSISMPSVEEIGHSFMESNMDLQEISLPNVRTIGRHFLTLNRDVYKVFMPNVEKIGQCFLECNTSMREIMLPSIEFLYKPFLPINEDIIHADIPNIEIFDPLFFKRNPQLKRKIKKMKKKN